MIYSKNNIIVPISNAEPPEYAIMNPLTGGFDRMSEMEYQVLAEFKETGRMDPEQLDLYEYLLERGYCFRNQPAEAARIQQEFARFQTERASAQIQLILNLSCSGHLPGADGYERWDRREGFIDQETVDAFFHYIHHSFRGAKLKPFITLSGGEPLMNAPAHYEIVGYIVNRLAAEDYELSIITNGYALAGYMELLSNARIKEIQVIMDGRWNIYDQQPETRKDRSSFSPIISGLRAAIGRGFPVNLRALTDLQNMRDLVNLARFADAEGWLDLGPERFWTQLGWNDECFSCYAGPEYSLSQVELWVEFAKLSRDYPILRKFHRPSFHGIRNLVDTRFMVPANFDACPAAKTQWVFDLHGFIYGCTAGCGRNQCQFGTFYPEVYLYQGRINEWQGRNILVIPKCRDCRYNVICGGGCGITATGRSGKLESADCPPIQELMEIGVNYYAEEIRRMTE